MGKPSLLTWKEIEPVASDIFNIRCNGVDKDWAEMMWRLMEKTPLVWYHNEQEKTQVFIRLFCLGSFLRHYVALCEMENTELDELYLSWFYSAELDHRECVALAGRKFVDEDDVDDCSSFFDDDVSLDDDLYELIDHEMPNIIKWLTVLTGGNDHLILTLNTPTHDILTLSEGEAYCACYGLNAHQHDLLRASILDWIQRNFDLW